MAKLKKNKLLLTYNSQNNTSNAPKNKLIENPLLKKTLFT